MCELVKRKAAFYLLVAVIVVVAVFPFYYAILTSLKSGTALFQVDYWPKTFICRQLRDRLHRGDVRAQPR